MPEIIIQDGIPPTPNPSPENDMAELVDLSNGYGPKRVKTPNLEVEQYDPLTVQKAQERRSTTRPTLNSIVWSKAVPKHRNRNCECD